MISATSSAAATIASRPASRRACICGLDVAGRGAPSLIADRFIAATPAGREPHRRTPPLPSEGADPPAPIILQGAAGGGRTPPRRTSPVRSDAADRPARRLEDRQNLSDLFVAMLGA